MLESMFGPYPPRDLMEDLPEGITPEAALRAWRKGLEEGGSGKPYRTFEENPDIQPFYHDGFQKGADTYGVTSLLEEDSERVLWDRMPEGLKRPILNMIGLQPIPQALLYWLGAIYLLIRIGRSLVGKD